MLTSIKEHSLLSKYKVLLPPFAAWTIENLIRPEVHPLPAATPAYIHVVSISNRPTVKLVYKDHPRDQHNVVLLHRWSLYTGSITRKVYLCGPMKYGLYKHGLYIQVVFSAGLKGFCYMLHCLVFLNGKSQA